jgi:hypothetical protein
MTTQLSTVFGNVNCHSTRDDGTTFDTIGQHGLEILAVNGANDGPYFEPTEGTEYGRWSNLNDKCIQIADCNLFTLVDELDRADGEFAIDSTDTDVPHNYGAWCAWVIPAGSGPTLYGRVKAELKNIKKAAKADKKAAKKAAKADKKAAKKADRKAAKAAKKAAKRERTFQDLDADAQRRGKR